MPVQPDRLRSSVMLVGCLVLGALSACVNMEPDPPPSPPSPPPTPNVSFDGQAVTLNGEQFWEQKYLDRRILVPLSGAYISENEISPSWYIVLPRDLPTRPPEDWSPISPGMSVRYRDARLAEPQDSSWLTLQDVESLTLVPDELRQDWNLIFFRSPLVAKGVQDGRGYWVPADLSFRTHDGRRLVIYCSPYYRTGPQTNPHYLRCRFYVKVSERIVMDVMFRGTFLPDWKSVYDTAIFRIEQRVIPLDGPGAPRPLDRGGPASTSADLAR
jgi:hypothetical protein